MAGFDRCEKAYHEAGHAVAAYFLNRAITSATIEPNEESGGHVDHPPRGSKYLEDLEEAAYDCKWGGFIKARTRRCVETDIMISLAGGLVHQQMTGREAHQVGAGLKELDDEEARDFAERFGGPPERWKHVITVGDWGDITDLACKVSGSHEEARAYVEWLQVRTEALIHGLSFMDCVEALAAALGRHGTLNGRQVREVIKDAHRAWVERTTPPLHRPRSEPGDRSKEV